MGFFPGSYVEELPDPAQPPKTPAPAITDGKEERPASRPGSAQGMAGPGMPGMPGGMQGGMPGGMPGEPGKPF